MQEVRLAAAFAIDDPMAVFAFVFESLSDRVNVYPTENYYYFSFYHAGVRYAGNIRIEPADDGKVAVHFAYAEDLSEWRDDTPVRHVRLDEGRGVTVAKTDRLAYRVSYAGKSVLFALNDLSHVKPPPGMLGTSEIFIGPIFDESAIRFFFVYDSRQKVFHYLLDESDGVADQFVASRLTDRITIGKRTGFAFYKDHRHDRKVLIGVNANNVRFNTYFDGPFDQLPDNFIEGEALRNAILDVAPRLKGRIDRFGSTFDGQVRYLIAPYIPYQTEDDLRGVHRCATSRLRALNYHQCFASVPLPPDLGEAPSEAKKAKQTIKKSRAPAP